MSAPLHDPTPPPTAGGDADAPHAAPSLSRIPRIPRADAAAAAEDADAAANDAAGGNPAEELGGPVHFETLFC